MKRVLLVVLIVILVPVAILVFFPGAIPSSWYRARLETAVEQALHRDVTFAGDLGFTLFPQVAFRASDVSIANADGFGDAPLAEMREMRVATGLEALLNREIDVREFVLVDPVIRLEQRPSGNNWTFTAPDATGAPAASDGGFARRPGALPIDASFGDLRIVNGAVSFTQGGETQSLTGLDVEIDMPSLAERAVITGTASANGEAMAFDAELGSVRGFFEGEATDLVLALGGDLLDVRFDGQLAESEAIEWDGAFSADIPSIAALGRFAGADMPADLPLRHFATRGRLSGALDRLTLQADTLTLDEITGSGRLAAVLGGVRPRLNGTLDLETLDLTPYLPEPGGPAAAGPSGFPAWSEDPVNLDALGLADASLALTVGTLRFRDIVVSDAQLTSELSDRRLEANLSRLSLYQGTGSARVVANARGATPSYALTASLDGLDARPFLAAAAGFDRIAGTGAVNLDFTASGASQADMVRSLAGNGAFNFADGAIIGINIAETIRNVGSLLGRGSATGATDAEGNSEEAEVGEEARTDFTALSGTFSARNGQIGQSDLAMLSPLLRVAGEGMIDLPAQTLDYRLRPRAVASLQGQGGATDLRGIVVPIRVRGAFDNLSFGVDTQAVGEALLTGALNNALGNEGGSVSPEEAVRNTLLDAIGLSPRTPPAEEGDTDGTEDGEPEQADPAEQLLRGLLRSRQRSQDSDAPAEDEDG